MCKNVHATWYENVNHFLYETMIYLLHIKIAWYSKNHTDTDEIVLRQYSTKWHEYKIIDV